MSKLVCHALIPFRSPILRKIGKNAAVLLSCVFVLCPVSVFGKTRVLWLGKASVMGGQYKAEGNIHRSGILSNLVLSPVFAFNDRQTLYPIYMLNFRSFQDVLDVAGGGTLFHETLENHILLKYTQKLGNKGWSAKPFLSAKSEKFREDKDQSWRKGLFNYDRYGGGVSFTYRTKGRDWVPDNFNIGYAFYGTHFPNFEVPASRFGSEITRSDSPGIKTLNNESGHTDIRAEWIFSPRFRLQTEMDFIRRLFSNQRIVQEDAGFSDEKRLDREQRFEIVAVTYLGREKSIPSIGAGRSLGLGYQYYGKKSNQNHFDADPSRLRFIPRYYDYDQATLYVVGQWAFSKIPLGITLKFSTETRDYLDRLVQAADGTYGTEPIRQETAITSLNLSYRLWKGMSLRSNLNWRKSTSNTDFERTYRYNFEASNFFGGVSYEF